MHKIKCLLIFFQLFLFTATAQQKQGANWFFGGQDYNNEPGAHFNFNISPAQISAFRYTYNTGSGAATISDQNGQLLFFSTYGHVASKAIVNGKYQEMPNGNVFGTYQQGTFSELIIQNPGNLNIYYIFFITNDYLLADHDLYVAQVDMRLNNGLGDIVANSLQLLKRKVGPGLAAMLHANNQHSWLVSHNKSGDSLQARLIDFNSIGQPVTSVSNKKLDPFSLIKSSPNSEMLVTTGLQNVELFQFNRVTGSFSNYLSLSLLNPTQQQGYTYAFSPDNSKLYVGTKKPNPTVPNARYSIVQYNLAAGNAQLIQQSASTIYSPNDSGSRISNMQLAVDGKIYITRVDTIFHYLSRINCPDLVGPACNFKLRAVYSPGNIFSATLPSLNQTIFRKAGILQAQAIKDTICYGDSVQLSAYGAGAERFQWQAANGLVAPNDTLANPMVNPAVTTTYTVTGYSACASNTASVTVVVLPKPAITIRGSASVCPQVQGVWYKVQNPQKQQIIWGVKGGTIATTSNDSISVSWGNASNTAQVWAIPKNIKGCSGDTVFFPVTINVILATETPKGTDTFCLASAFSINYKINATTGSVYTWGIQGGSISAGQGTANIKVNWRQAGIGKLWVQEESQTSTSLCRGLSDTLKVLIYPSPVKALEIKGPAQVFTFAENLVYQIENPATGSSYNWQINNGEIISGQGSAKVAINWKSAGNGTLEVREVNQFNCSGTMAALKVNIEGIPQPVFYNLITPNHDAKNDVFVIGNLKYYAENELVIYNRWGGQIYRKQNYRNTWKAENVAVGVYYYYFKANGKSWKGWIEVAK